MPTKRQRRRRALVPSIPLDEPVILTLLSGWGASTLRSEPADDLYFENDAGCARLWRQHEHFLRGEARRRGIAPAFPDDDPCLYFAEFCAFREATCRPNG